MLIRKGNVFRLSAVTLSVLMVLETVWVSALDAKTDPQTKAKVFEKPRVTPIYRRPYALISKLRTRHLPIPDEKRWEVMGEAKNVLSLATTGGKLFAVAKDNRLLVRDAGPAAQKWRDIGNAGNAIAIAGAKEKLFAVTKDNNLLVTSTQGWKKVSSAGNTIGIAIARRKLFGITNDNKLLVRDATPSVQRWKNIGDAGNALSITSIGGNLLAVTKNKKLLLREAIPSSAPWSTAATTTNIISMSAARGKIFGLSKDGKLQFQPLPDVQPPSTKFPAGVRIQDLPTWLRVFLRQGTRIGGLWIAQFCPRLRNNSSIKSLLSSKK